MKDDLFGGLKDDWQTPKWLFDALNQEFDFTLDPCANPSNALGLRIYCTESERGDRPNWCGLDGLSLAWNGHSAFVNPPYSKMKEWMGKCAAERHCAKAIVALIPARTDTAAWHDFIFPTASEIRFLRGRVQFVGATAGAKFPSALVIWRRRRAFYEKNERDPLITSTLDLREIRPKREPRPANE